MNRDPAISEWYLVRHATVAGVTDGLYREADPPADLSDQAPLAYAAARLPQGAVWRASPLTRTIETARALARLGSDPQDPDIEPDLREQDFGDWHGLDFPTLWPRIAHLPAHNWSILAPETRPPGGDSFLDVWQRVGALQAAIDDSHAGSRQILITHAGVIRAFVGRALGLEPDRALAMAISPLSVTHLLHRRGQGRGGDWQLVYLNATG